MKLSFTTWLVLGICFLILPIAAAYFMFYKKDMQHANYLTEYAEAAKIEGDKMPAAKRRVETAQQDVAEIVAEWDSVAAVKTPPANLEDGGINLGVNIFQLTVDSMKFRDSVQRAVNAQARMGGVTVVAVPRVTDPTDDATQILATYYNYPAAQEVPVALFELGQVTVTGSYDQIAANVRSWSSMPNYLAVVDDVAISGTYPLTATYNVNIVAFIRGKNLPPSTVAAAVPAADGAAAPAQPGAPR